MMPNNNNGDNQPLNTQPAETGNASNPSVQNNNISPSNDNQLLGKEAEKYLRESANIGDLPDAQDEEEVNIKKPGT